MSGGTASIGGTSGLMEGNSHLLLIQLYGVAVTLAWSAGITYVLLKLISPLRPGLLETGDGSGFVYLIMPIRLNV